MNENIGLTTGPKTGYKSFLKFYLLFKIRYLLYLNRFMRFDANHDGTVDRDEWNAGQEARFKQLDTNDDGKLSQEELFARSSAARGNAAPADRQAQRQAAYFRRLDRDNDGFVSKAEFMAQANQNFARCDLNKDNHIDTAECRQALRRRPSQPVSTDR